MAVCLQASLLVRHSTPEVADAFVASRLADDWGGVFGTLPRTTPFTPILDRTSDRVASEDPRVIGHSSSDAQGRGHARVSGSRLAR